MFCQLSRSSVHNHHLVLRGKSTALPMSKQSPGIHIALIPPHSRATLNPFTDCPSITVCFDLTMQAANTCMTWKRKTSSIFQRLFARHTCTNCATIVYSLCCRNVSGRVSDLCGSHTAGDGGNKDQCKYQRWDDTFYHMEAHCDTMMHCILDVRVSTSQIMTLMLYPTF